MAEPRTRPPTGEFGEPLYEPSGYDFDEPLYDESNWWEVAPERPAPPTPPSIPGGSPSGFHPGAPARQRPRGYTGLSPAMEGAVAAYRPSAGGGLSKADIFSLGLDRVDRGKSFKNIRKEKEAAKRLEEKWQLEKDKWEEKKKQFQEQLELRKLAILKPSWGI